jgi:cytochrome c oxidase subunit IV
LVALGVLSLWTALPSRSAELPPDPDTSPRDPKQKMLLASLPTLALSIWLLGAALGIALYLVVVGRLLGERRWGVLLVLAACAAVIVVVGFVRLLGVPLPLMPGWAF